MLHIYNSLSKHKELFKPLIPGKVSLYVCGMTVYDYCHIGHGRLFVLFDLVTRYLRSQGYEVCYVRNITDIDDKIIQRALENGERPEAVAERFIQATQEDEDALKVLPPDRTPRATHSIPQIIAIISTLIAKGYAYVVDGGDVFYAVDKFADYGKFSNQTLEKLQSGARVNIIDVKHNPLDFVLWKLAKPGEPSWDSPWGQGRPGWHIECSAMVCHCLGEHIDIHGGGLDLVFPHHQNEIAQSEAAFGGRFVNTWMHMGYVQVNREKMSKSLGNFSTIREILTQYDVEVVRYFMLASHYRSPINYSTENLHSANAALARLYTCLRGLAPNADFSAPQTFSARFNAAMDDDFNTPVALAVLFDLAREINRLRDDNHFDQAAGLGVLLKQLAGIFGLLQHDPDIFLKSGATTDVNAIEQLVNARNSARAQKQWQTADTLRQQLDALGIVLEDKPDGTTTWRLTRE